MGKGGDASAVRRNEYFISESAEPHASRKREILKKHPEIKALMGHEPLTKYIVAATVALQVFMAQLTVDWSWGWYLVALYVVGATANHSLFLAIHELSHGLGYSPPLNPNNKYLSMLANFPIGIPYCVNFKPYHMAHHREQGVDGVDTDIPTKIEAWFVTDTSTTYIGHTVKKAAFMFCQIFFYALRPCFMRPDMIVHDAMLAKNWIAQMSFNAVLVYFFGWNAYLYMLLSSFFAGSIHPTAGHFIAEHYIMEGTTETYSYYGPLNCLAYNVGFHNEHHDFPNIPWSNLPKVRKIAPEFYDDLPQCSSWPGVILRYIFDDAIGPYSRMKRGIKSD